MALTTNIKGHKDIDGNFTATGTILGSNLSGTNTGDQTTIVGIEGTKAEFDTAVTDGNIMYDGDAYTKSESDGKYLLNTTDTFTGILTVDGDLIVDTDTGVSAFYVSRNGGTDQSLKMWTIDDYSYIQTLQDENESNYANLTIRLGNQALQKPQFKITDYTSGSEVNLFLLDSDGRSATFFGVLSAPDLTLTTGGVIIQGVSSTITGLRLDVNTAGTNNRLIDIFNTSSALRFAWEYDNTNIKLKLVDRNRVDLFSIDEATGSGTFKGEIKGIDALKKTITNVSSAYTVTASDAAVVRRVTSGTFNITVDTGSLANIGETAEVDNSGSGTITILAGTATLRVNGNDTLVMDGQYSRIAIQKMTSTDYRVFGQLALA